MKPGKHQRSKYRGQDLCWKVHNLGQHVSDPIFAQVYLVLTTSFSLTMSNFKCISYTIFSKVRHLSSPVTIVIDPNHQLDIYW